MKGAHNLIRPSDSMVTVLVQYGERFKGFATADTILDPKAPFRSISRFLAGNVDVRLGACEQHEEKVEELFLERLPLRQQKAQNAEGHTSKICARVNLE